MTLPTYPLFLLAMISVSTLDRRRSVVSTMTKAAMSFMACLVVTGQCSTSRQFVRSRINHARKPSENTNRSRYCDLFTEKKTQTRFTNRKISKNKTDFCSEFCFLEVKNVKATVRRFPFYVN